MKIDVSIDVKSITAYATRFPVETAKAIQLFTDRVGYKIEREAKVAAPVITGNLRRQIRFIESSSIAGVVKAFANYSGFVHGAPFFQSKMKRKETPFFTMALGNSKMFIQAEADKIIPTTIRNIEN